MTEQNYDKLIRSTINRCLSELNRCITEEESKTILASREGWVSDKELPFLMGRILGPITDKVPEDFGERGSDLRDAVDEFMTTLFKVVYENGEHYHIIKNLDDLVPIINQALNPGGMQPLGRVLPGRIYKFKQAIPDLMLGCAELILLLLSAAQDGNITPLEMGLAGVPFVDLIRRLKDHYETITDPVEFSVFEAIHQGKKEYWTYGKIDKWPSLTDIERILPDMDRSKIINILERLRDRGILSNEDDTWKIAF